MSNLRDIMLQLSAFDAGVKHNKHKQQREKMKEYDDMNIFDIASILQRLIHDDLNFSIQCYMQDGLPIERQVESVDVTAGKILLKCSDKLTLL